MKVALGIEYDGSHFHGWQSQPDGQTIQNVLENALAQVAGQPVRTFCAGRTDSGVHALEQIVHFVSPVSRPVNAWVRGVNRYLPPSVAVLWARPVADEFHARYSASARRYHYWLLNRPVRASIYSAYVGWYHLPLQVERMQEAASLLTGEHDYSSFRSTQCQSRTPVRHLQQLQVEQRDEYILFRLQANAFLHHMVRNLIGCLVYIGKGTHPPRWAQTLLEAADRSLAPPTFPPQGLYLFQVLYPEHFQLRPHRQATGSAGLPIQSR